MKVKGRHSLKAGLVTVTALILAARLAYSLGLPDAVDKKLKQLGQDSSFICSALKFELLTSGAGLAQPQHEEKKADEKNLFLKYMPVSGIDGSGKTELEQSTAAQMAVGEEPAPEGKQVTLTSDSINNRTSKTVNIEELAGRSLEIDMSQEGPKVLIYHTHASEAYTPDGTDVYVESDPSRTEDCSYNMVRVGKEVARVLEEHGIETIQADTLHDYPSYNGSYARSLETVEDYLETYPSIQIVLDLHRDALQSEDGTVLSTVADSSVAQDTAQLLLVVGTDEGGLEHTGWENNLSFALQLQAKIEENHPTLARPLSLRASRFNQHTSPCALLVEIGCNGNTLRQALNCATLFGENLAQLLLEQG